MELIETNLMLLPRREQFHLSFDRASEGASAYTLYINYRERIPAVIEGFWGAANSGVLQEIRNSIITPVSELGGYIDDTDEIHPLEIYTRFSSGDLEISQVHLIKFGLGSVTLVLSILTESTELEILEFRNFLNDILINSEYEHNGDVGDCLPIIFPQSIEVSEVGSRMVIAGK